jgi:hypothetical protein
MLPVYLQSAKTLTGEDRYRIDGTREGMLQPWTRLRATEQAERRVLADMPELRVMNLLDSIKPGATVLRSARGNSGKEYPAMVSQRFGSGRTLAVTVGDLWRWSMRRREDDPRDMQKAWRQTIRWLVADVPRRVEAEARPVADDPHGTIAVRITARRKQYEPLDNARARIRVEPPEGEATVLTAEPSEQEAGVYLARYVPTAEGAYRAEVTVTAADGSKVGSQAIGWTAEPARREFEQIQPRRETFEEFAQSTGGRLVSADELDDFVADLPNEKSVVTETWVYPFWHQWWILVGVAGCFVSEWALRRWKGLA